jgi:hypothetical protein
VKSKVIFWVNCSFIHLWKMSCKVSTVPEFSWVNSPLYVDVSNASEMDGSFRKVNVAIDQTMFFLLFFGFCFR